METRNTETFEKIGLGFSSCNLETGKTYWIYGCITDFITDTPDKIVVELNFSIHANITLQSQEKINLLKERIYENGIFVCTVTSTDENVNADCHTVVFGRKQDMLV